MNLGASAVVSHLFDTKSVKFCVAACPSWSKLNPEKIWHDYLTHLSTSPVRCSHFTLWNPKSFNGIIHTYFRLSDYLVMSEVNKLQLLYYSWAVYLLLFSASYCLHSPITASGAHYRRSACIEYSLRYGRVAAAACCDILLNSSTALCTMRLISGEKDWKHVSMQKVVTLNICFDVVCLTFQLPHITTGSF